MSDAPDPKSFVVEHVYVGAQSLENVQVQLRCGEPLMCERAEAEKYLTMFEASTGKRQYIFALDIRIQQVTS
jgi:hypothetical protein